MRRVLDAGPADAAHSAVSCEWDTAVAGEAQGCTVTLRDLNDNQVSAENAAAALLHVQAFVSSVGGSDSPCPRASMDTSSNLSVSSPIRYHHDKPLSPIPWLRTMTGLGLPSGRVPPGVRQTRSRTPLTYRNCASQPGCGV